jgi:8-oxo-dGTP diphosphatase
MNDFIKYTDYKTVLSVNALIWCKGKVLMLRRKDDKKIDPGLYAGVGGKVEPHESFYEALYREVEEETGISEFESMRLYSVTQHPFPPTDSEWVNLYFIINIAKQIKVKPSNDGTFHWIDPKEIDTLPTPTDIKDYIKILSKNPNAFIMGFFDHDKDGNLIEKSIHVL